MNAIVLAGEKKNSIPVDDENQQTENKAFIKINNRLMIDYVIDTLKRSRLVDKIAIVGPVEKLSPIVGERVDFLVESGGSIVQNGLKAMECFDSDKEVLIVTSDIPMITVEAIEHFIEKSREQQVDLAYPIVSKDTNDSKCPEVKRTYAKLWEGRFTGGNIIYFNPAVRDRCKDFVEKMFEYRKNPAKMAGVLGVGFLLRMALGILTINAVMKKCEKLMGIKCAAVISPYPEIGNDVDKPSDIEFAKKQLA